LVSGVTGVQRQTLRHHGGRAIQIGDLASQNERNDAAVDCFPLGLRVGGIEKKDKIMAGRIMFFPTMIYPS
jgi:hypothetical protein